MADEEKPSAFDVLREAHANGQLHPAIVPALDELFGTELAAEVAEVLTDIQRDHKELRDRVAALELDNAARKAEAPAPAGKGSAK